MRNARRVEASSPSTQVAEVTPHPDQAQDLVLAALPNRLFLLLEASPPVAPRLKSSGSLIAGLCLTQFRHFSDPYLPDLAERPDPGLVVPWNAA